MYNFTTVYICINYSAISLLTSAIHRQQSFLRSRPKCKIFNIDNLKV